MEEHEPNPEDIINVLIATDNHLGYLEKDSIRAQDSFIAFEEILCLAQEHNVDFILLGGDLFHEAKPTPACLSKTTKLIQKYCFGDKPVAIQMLSDQNENFGRCVNYEDPNLNISYPIFSIHGNHDDPVGQESISSLDILSNLGLINYFGKWTDYNQVNLSPLLIRKGQTNLSLYGLSHLSDPRLARLFRDGKIEIAKIDDGNEWFNLLTLHQNRADRGKLTFVPENVLPGFLDFILWGHEHDCHVDADWNGEKKFFVYQPGSSVATSLDVGESLPKHVGLIQIYKKTFKLTPIPLKTVRPFVFKTIVLSEENLGTSTINAGKIAQEFLKKKVLVAIDESKTKLSGHPNQPKLPLVRLNVFYENESQLFNTVRFNQQFDTVVACKDIVKLKSEAKLHSRKVDPANIDHEALEDMVKREAFDDINVESLLEKYYREQPAEKQLSILSVRAMNQAVTDFTQKNNDESFRKAFEMHKKRYLEFLMKSNAETVEEVSEQMSLCKQQVDALDEPTLRTMLDSTSVSKNVTSRIISMSDDENEEPEVTIPTPTRGRGRGRGRGSRGGRGATASNQSSLDISTGSVTRKASANSSDSTKSKNNWLDDLKASKPTRTSQRKVKSPIRIDDSDSD